VRDGVEWLEKFPDSFLAEIAGQAEAMRRAADGLSGRAAALERIAAAAGAAGSIVFTGMGASLAACQIPATLLTVAGVDAWRVDAAELLHFRRATLRPGIVLVLVSQSGRSAELVALARSFRDDARPFLVSVTNGSDNALAVEADAALDIRAGEEQGPSTMTFAASVVVLSALADVLANSGVRAAVDEVRLRAHRAAAAARRLVAQDVGSLEAWLGERPVAALLGRGSGLAAAEAGALLLQEAARVPALSFGSGRFRHGPIELAGPDLAAAVFATEESTRDIDLGLASDLVELGTSVLVIGSAEVPSGAIAAEVPHVGGGLGAVLGVIPVQLLAHRLSLRRGLTPGRLTIATKVTSRE
jgi:glucosamine--fructose-6-phosphate aminotransferase (isomerizing)